MSNPSPPTEWSYPFWRALDETADFQGEPSVRTGLFDTLCSLTDSSEQTTPAVLSTTAATDLVEETLHDTGILNSTDNYTQSQFNQVFPELEQLGVSYRLPKLHRDDQYYIFPTTPLSQWLQTTPQNPVLTPTHEPDSYSTCLFGDYINTHNSTTDPTAGTQLPLKALIYTTVGMHAPLDAVSPEQTHTFTPDTVDVSVSTGDIETLRTTDSIDISTLADHLNLNTTLPPADETVPGGAHDTGLFGRLTIPPEIQLTATDRLEQRLSIQLESWIASVLSLYTPEPLAQDRKRRGDSDSEASSPNSDTAEPTDQTTPFLSRAQYTDAIADIASQPPRDHINRYGLDTQVLTDNSEPTRILYGIYRRTNQSQPVDPTTPTNADADD